MEENEIKVTAGLSVPLETIGIITGIVLCILQGIGTIDIGWFWAIFPFWIVIAFDAAIILLIFIIIGISTLVIKIRDR